MTINHHLNEHDSEFGAGSREPAQLLSDVRARVAADFVRETGREIDDDLGGPSASVAIAQAGDGCIELANIGDCRILYQDEQGTVRSFGTSNVTAFDKKVVDKAIELGLGTGMPYKDMWPFLREIVRENREWMNRDAGYWVFDLSDRWKGHIQTQRMRSRVNRQSFILIMSDGFYRLTDTFKAHTDETLLAKAVNGGIDSLFAQLREAEANDSECKRFPRIKSSDDASALLLCVSSEL